MDLLSETDTTLHHWSEDNSVDFLELGQLFVDLAGCLDTGGALLLADVIEPASQQVADLFARQYDEMVREQSRAKRGDLSGYQQFSEMKWNYFIHDYGSPNPDPIDHPSR